MARYKVLKSVAHSLGHSFTSLMNYRDEDYVMGHLLRRARQVGEGTLQIDLINGTAQPETLLVPPVRDAVTEYAARLRSAVTSHQTTMEVVQAASMAIRFDLSRNRAVRGRGHLVESPYVCRVEITDNRGKPWVAQLEDWWYPEAGEVLISESGLSSIVHRFGKALRSIWAGRSR